MQAASDTECVKACERSGMGDTVACFAQNASLCASRDGGRQAVAELCDPPGNTIEPVCDGACFDTFKVCVLDCPAPSLEECLPCGNGCADTFDACRRNCPSG